MKSTIWAIAVIAVGLLPYPGVLLAQEAKTQTAAPTPAPSTAGSTDRDVELEKARAEADKSRAEAEQAKAQAEAEKAKAEAEKAKAEAERAKAETERAKLAEKAAPAPEPHKNNNLTCNVLGLIIGGVSIGYTGAVGDVVSIGLRGLFLFPVLTDFSAAGGEISLLFWTKHPNNGFFLGPFLQISKTFPPKDDYVEWIGVLTVTPGIELGYRWLWNSGFNIGLGAGIGYAAALDRDKECPSDAICDYVGEGVSPLLLFDLGYAF